MTAHVILQNICDAADVPSKSALTKWVNAALGQDAADIEICIRIVDRAESQNLNDTYRQQDKPTNVLSFPFDMSDIELDLPILGDLVICADIIRQEAEQQGKKISAHWAHMVIHGTLHLLGMDHLTDEQAADMEKIEIDLLRDFGYDNPYEEHP